MLRFYNTLSKEKEEFRPSAADFVRVYDCGPTVYSFAHIGNMWRYLASDLARRVLEFNGYEVKQVMNITDVGHLTDEDLAADTGEDKVLVAAQKEKKTPEQLAFFYTQAFVRDLDRLNIQQPTVMPKATEHIDEMIDLIRRLEARGFTYRAGKYLCFEIGKFPAYGELSGKNIEDLRAGERLKPIPEKRNPYDFALWVNDPGHLMRWDSPWGSGYPGWHIECSAISMKYLGEQLDIHSGGEDNIFPHHENEIAQSESATGKQFVRYWLHVRHNLVDGRKMSKSLGNLVLLQNIIDAGFDPLAYRYLCLTTHYRSNLNFTWGSLTAAQKGLSRLRRFFSSPVGIGEWESDSLEGYRRRFAAAVNDDLNLPRALAVVWDLVGATAKDGRLPPLPRKLIFDFDRVLGLELQSQSLVENLGDIPPSVKSLVSERETFRSRDQFDKADELRGRIATLGYLVEDTPDGPVVRRA